MAVSFTGRTQIGAAMRFASLSPADTSVTCVTGSLLSAAHSIKALPVDLVSPPRTGLLLDTLTRDLVAEVTDSPGGSEYSEG